MTVTTNSTIEFESKEELNNYLNANGDTFSNVNYLISHINNVCPLFILNISYNFNFI